jgi:hypothetical protein
MVHTIRYKTLLLVMTSGFQCTYDVLQKHIIAITSAQNMTSDIEADYTIRG